MDHETQDGPDPVNRGTAVEIGPDAQRVGVLDWRAKHKPGCGTRAHGLVSLVLTQEGYPVDTADANDGAPIAAIEYGVGGRRFKVEADWTPGALLVLPADTLCVDAFLAYPDANTQTSLIGAAAHRGAATAFRRATRTVRASVTSAAPATIAIPPLARAVTVLTADRASLSVLTVTAQTSTVVAMPGVLLGQWTGAALDLSLAGMPSGLQLPGAARALAFTRTGAGTALVRAVFHLGV